MTSTKALKQLSKPKQDKIETVSSKPKKSPLANLPQLGSSERYRQQYTTQFREHACELAERIGVAKAALELDLTQSRLYAWRSKRLRTGKPFEEAKRVRCVFVMRNARSCRVSVSAAHRTVLLVRLHHSFANPFIV